MLLNAVKSFPLNSSVYCTVVAKKQNLLSTNSFYANLLINGLPNIWSEHCLLRGPAGYQIELFKVTFPINTFKLQASHMKLLGNIINSMILKYPWRHQNTTKILLTKKHCLRVLEKWMPFTKTFTNPSLPGSSLAGVIIRLTSIKPHVLHNKVKKNET